MRRILPVLLLLVGCSQSPPSGPDTLPPVKTSEQPEVYVALDFLPPAHGIIRPGQEITLAVSFTAPTSAYPLTANIGLVYPNSLGGSSGLACEDKTYRVQQLPERLSCRLRIERSPFEDYSSTVAGPIDVGFTVFNWSGEEHAGSIHFYRRFPTGYTYTP